MITKVDKARSKPPIGISDKIRMKLLVMVVTSGVWKRVVWWLEFIMMLMEWRMADEYGSRRSLGGRSVYIKHICGSIEVS